MIVRYRDGALRWMFGSLQPVEMGQYACRLRANRGVSCS